MGKRTRSWLMVAAVCAALSVSLSRHASAGESPVQVTYFALDRVEAAKGEQVVARWSFIGSAGKVAIATATLDGTPLPYIWPVVPVNANAGMLAFTVPVSLGTLSPLVIVLRVDNKNVQSTPLLIQCDVPWFFQPRADGCPNVPVIHEPAMIQEFDRGRMIWLHALRSVLVLYDDSAPTAQAGRWEIFSDDPTTRGADADMLATLLMGTVPPAPQFAPILESQLKVLNGVGWPAGRERSYAACFAQVSGGSKKSMYFVNDADGGILQLTTYDLPAVWSRLKEAQGQRIVFEGCNSSNASNQRHKPHVRHVRH